MFLNRERTLSIYKGARGGGGGGVLKNFQKIFRSPGDYRVKYYMLQQFYQKISDGPTH